MKSQQRAAAPCRWGAIDGLELQFLHVVSTPREVGRVERSFSQLELQLSFVKSNLMTRGRCRLHSDRSAASKYPDGYFPYVASALVDVERRAEFEQVGVHYEAEGCAR
jgi:hypothetical protein